MLSPLFQIIKDGQLKNISLQLSLIDGKPVVLIQATALPQNSNATKTASDKEKASKIRAVLATPLVVTSTDIDQIDVELHEVVPAFCDKYNEILIKNNLIEALASLEKSPQSKPSAPKAKENKGNTTSRKKNTSKTTTVQPVPLLDLSNNGDKPQPKQPVQAEVATTEPKQPAQAATTELQSNDVDDELLDLDEDLLNLFIC